MKNSYIFLNEHYIIQDSNFDSTQFLIFFVKKGKLETLNIKITEKLSLMTNKK